MQKTIDQIVRGSNLPLSIIIVGVGSDDFESMDILDADDNPLYSMKYKKYMDADIVQFVPYRDFRHNPAQLAKETLEEVPGQLLDYFKRRNIDPLPANPVKKREIMQKLQAQRSMGGKQKVEGDEFFDARKEQLIQKMVDMGMDLVEVTDFIEDKGLFEENPEIIIDQM
jgi:hypothetical protein